MASPISSSISQEQLKQLLRAVLSRRQFAPWRLGLTAPQLLTTLDQLRALRWLTGHGEGFNLTKPARAWLTASADDPAFPWLDERDEGRLDVRQQMAFPNVGQRTQINVWKRISVQAGQTATAGESPAGDEQGFEP